jgi:hypothetical protein
MYLRYCNIHLGLEKEQNNPYPLLFGGERTKQPLPFTLWPFKSQVSAAARPPFKLYVHYGMFSFLDEKDVYIMGHCPICQFKVKS